MLPQTDHALVKTRKAQSYDSDITLNGNSESSDSFTHRRRNRDLNKNNVSSDDKQDNSSDTDYISHRSLVNGKGKKSDILGQSSEVKCESDRLSKTRSNMESFTSGVESNGATSEFSESQESDRDSVIEKTLKVKENQNTNGLRMRKSKKVMKQEINWMF